MRKQVGIRLESVSDRTDVRCGNGSEDSGDRVNGFGGLPSKVGVDFGEGNDENGWPECCLS
jgi:hypothetical protein